MRSTVPEIMFALLTARPRSPLTALFLFRRWWRCWRGLVCLDHTVNSGAAFFLFLAALVRLRVRILFLEIGDAFHIGARHLVGAVETD
jgi:hypothetical protein